MSEILNTIHAPISADAPCGVDLSFSSEFDHIQEARREDDPTLDYGEWQTTLKQADWPAVVDRCTDLLANRSKDLRLSAWLAEGLIKTSGFSGLAQGLEIIAGLLEQFGRDLHPQAEDGDQERRIGNLSWCVTRMSTLVRQTPITEARPESYSLNDYESARNLHVQLQRDSGSARDIENKITLEKFTSAVQKTDKSRYAQWSEGVDRCIDSLKRLTASSDALFGIDGPSFTILADSLDAVHFRLKSICKEIGIASPAHSETSAASEQMESMSPALVLTHDSAGKIRNRAHALEVLREVASFFRDTEPHSPVAYLADKAAQWGEMPLHAWLRAVVKDRGTLSNIEEMLGVEMEDSERRN